MQGFYNDKGDQMKSYIVLGLFIMAIFIAGFCVGRTSSLSDNYGEVWAAGYDAAYEELKEAIK